VLLCTDLESMSWCQASHSPDTYTHQAVTICYFRTYYYTSVTIKGSFSMWLGMSNTNKSSQTIFSKKTQVSFQKPLTSHCWNQRLFYNDHYTYLLVPLE
jgi:hypothetical protein